MPPTKKSSTSLKQGTLSFGASKRSNTNEGAKQKPIQRRSHSTPVQESIDDASSSDSELDDIQFVSSGDEEEEDVIQEEERRPTAAKRKAVTAADAKRVVRPRVGDGVRVELNVKAKKWDKPHAEAVKKRSSKKSIHPDGQDRIHEILRVFDMSYEYGPCVGVSRMDRWERADALGLKPPTVIYDILTTRQGAEDSSYSDNVLDQAFAIMSRND